MGLIWFYSSMRHELGFVSNLAIISAFFFVFLSTKKDKNKALVSPVLFLKLFCHVIGTFLIALNKT